MQKKCNPFSCLNTKSISFAITLTVLTGCAAQGDIKADFEGVQAGVSQGFKSLGSAVGNGVGNLRQGFKRPNGSRSSFATVDVASKYANDQVPHTLMKKPVKSGRLTSGFGYRLSPTGIRLPKRHKGVDFAAPTGTPVFAAGNGEVDKLYVSSSYGNYIRIAHENNFATAYAHLDTFADGLEVGSTVKRGQKIGTVGNTGRSTAAHLHYELIYKGKFIDPFLGQNDPAGS